MHIQIHEIYIIKIKKYISDHFSKYGSNKKNMPSLLTPAKDIEPYKISFYILTFYNFQRVDRNPYLVLNHEEQETATQMIAL